MKFAVAVLIGSISAIKVSDNKHWPSVARGVTGQISTDETPVDQSGERLDNVRNLDGTVGRTPTGPTSANLLPTAAFAQWPSVARCDEEGIPSDQWACDHANKFRLHNHDGVLGKDDGTNPFHIASANLLPDAAFVQWPSVARCKVADGSTDETACDDAGPPEHTKFHDDVVGRTPMGPTSANLLPDAAAAFVQVSAEEAADIVSQWPSVARCDEEGIPSDQWACDHANKYRLHNHDGVLGLDDKTNPFHIASANLLPDAAAAFVQVSAQWPSVARCDEEGIPSDQWACDHANKFRLHNHDGVLGQDNETNPFHIASANLLPDAAAAF